MEMNNWSDFNWLAHCVLLETALALLRAGSSIAAKIAMIVITTNNSINVNINEL
jgi:hypothetical protein